MEENYTFYYVSVFTGINLYKKGYIPVARFKNSLDKYIFISIQPLEKIIKKRYIKFATLNNPYFLLSLSYFSLSINLDITRFNTYFFESCEEIIEKIKNGEIDIGFIHYENFLDSKNKDEIKIHEKYTLEIPHYFMVINEPQLIEKIKQFLGSLDKNLIQTLGCKKIQIISEENLKLLKYIFPFCDITFNLLNAQKLSRAFIDSPYFGVLIYHKKYVWANEYACNLLGYSLEELKN